jgi:predicted nucleotidyltransferase
MYRKCSAAYPQIMTTETVTTVADARAGLSDALRRFRESASSAPIILGSHRKAEAALVPYALYRRLLADSSSRTSAPVLDQLRARRQLIQRIAGLNRIRSVAVFGSVARGDESASSDIDLLVDPLDDASLFDLAQFAIDLEQLMGRPVDVVSRRSVDARRDSAILADAVPL